MPFSLTLYAAVSLILFASSIVQGAVGFAAGMFAIPLLVLSGVAFPDAVAVSMVAAAPQNLIPAWQLRREIDFRLALRPMLIRFAALPFGVFVLYLVGQERKDLASQLVGVIVLAILVIQWHFRFEPKPRLHAAWEWIAFGFGGFLLGFCGIGGPTLALWVQAHDWPMNRARAFLFFIFSVGLPAQALLMWWFSKGQVLSPMILSAAAFPAVLIGLWIGLYLTRVIPDRALRRCSVAVLVLIAFSAIFSPYLRRIQLRPPTTGLDAMSVPALHLRKGSGL